MLILENLERRKNKQKGKIEKNNSVYFLINNSIFKSFLSSLILL